MTIPFKLLNILLLCLITATLSLQWDVPDTAERIRAQGYQAQKHEVETKDGYILTVYRIPRGKDSTSDSKVPVIIQHGYLCSSDSWVITDPSNALGFALADNGFDVWLPNSRGTTHSKKHERLSTEDDEYWDFSVHELGLYDLPAVIDYVLKETDRKTLSYIGHSQGTASFLIMASLLPEYNSKVNVACLLAPVAGLDNTRGATLAFGRVSKYLEGIADFFHMKYTLERSILYKIINFFCYLPVAGNVCEDMVFFIAGFDSPTLDKEMLRTVAEITPSGSSIKQIKHFGQWLRKCGRFSFYDYEDENMKIYNSTEPPDYSLNNVKTPVALFYSCNDFISSCNVSERVKNELGGPVEMYEVAKDFNHVDYMWATNAKEVLNPKIIQVLRRANYVHA